MFEFKQKKMPKKKNGSSSKAIDKKFSMQGMFMRFYGLETIHSNDKNGSRCENAANECASIFFLTSPYTLAAATITTTKQVEEEDEDGGDKGKIWTGKVLWYIHILVLCGNMMVYSVSFVIIKSNAQRNDGRMYACAALQCCEKKKRKYGPGKVANERTENCEKSGIFDPDAQRSRMMALRTPPFNGTRYTINFWHRNNFSKRRAETHFCLLIERKSFYLFLN